MAEYWDLYDADRKPLNRLHRRGDPLPEGCYHLVVMVWTRDREGRFLIDQRHPDKHFPLYWETTGGSVLAGEDSRTAAERELSEELGLVLSKDAPLIFQASSHDTHYDFYLNHWNGNVNSLRLQATEVVDARWADYEELCRIDDEGRLVFSIRSFRTLFAPKGVKS